jgi:hypothetical protein
LELILYERGLSWVQVDDALLITSKEAAAVRHEIRVYCVGDLLMASGRDPADRAGYNELIGLLTQGVQPQTWKPSEQGAAIEPFPNAGALVVRQTRAAHEEIKQLLAALCRAQARQAEAAEKPLRAASPADAD